MAKSPDTEQDYIAFEPRGHIILLPFSQIEVVRSMKFAERDWGSQSRNYKFIEGRVQFEVLPAAEYVQMLVTQRLTGE